MTFATEELIGIARGLDPGAPYIEVRDGLRYTFAIEYDDIGVMDHVNGADCYGALAWPVRDRYADHDRRPDGFTGAARKLGYGRDAIWWEPYREGHKVYDGPDEVRFMQDLFEYGFIGLSLTVGRLCECCDQWKLIGHESLWGIESPLVGKGNYEYLADVFSDLISEATPVKEDA